MHVHFDNKMSIHAFWDGMYKVLTFKIQRVKFKQTALKSYKIYNKWNVIKMVQIVTFAHPTFWDTNELLSLMMIKNIKQKMFTYIYK